MKKNLGFTLIELLAAMIVVIAVGTVLGVTLYSALQGATKTTTISQIKQNGFFAITQMTKMLRNAEDLKAPFPCIIPPSPTPVPSYSSITITSIEGLQTIFACDGTTISSNGASLLDTNAVSVASCFFTCTQTSITEPPTVGISFSLKQARVTTLAEHTASIPFETSIVLRNLSR